MATVRLTRQWADDSALVVEVSAEGQHPDLLDSLALRAVWLDRQACGESVEDE